PRAAAPAPQPERAPPPVAPAPEPAKPAAEAPAIADKAKETDDEPAEQPKEEEPNAAADSAKPHKAAPALVAVTFRSDPEGARVATKGHVYGTTPQAAKLAPGTAYELTFTKSGYAPASKRYVAPAAKGPVTLKVSLKKLPEPKKAAPPPPPPQRKGWWFQR
ncbi:MAG TPA: PEGA domain-containing protein, partial [Polyangia bacterium]|nr:PEGA domain-containing protein [Polyangia bacterium]